MSENVFFLLKIERGSDFLDNIVLLGRIKCFVMDENIYMPILNFLV